MKNTIAVLLFGAVCAAFAWSVEAQKPAPTPPKVEIREVKVTDEAAVFELTNKLRESEALVAQLRNELQAAKSPQAVPQITKEQSERLTQPAQKSHHYQQGVVYWWNGRRCMAGADGKLYYVDGGETKQYGRVRGKARGGRIRGALCGLFGC